MAIDWNFLEQVEGKKNTTYIPKNSKGAIQNSGVTIGTGVDLGQQSEAKFRKLGVPEEIIKKLTPFFGKTQDKAEKALNATGNVTLDDSEVSAIDKALKQDTLKKVKSWYNKDNKQGQDWSDLSDRQQTVVLSTFYNHGLDGAPSFKKQIEEGDWSAAADNLRSFYKTKDNELHSRRIKELQYLAGLPLNEVDGVDGPATDAAVAQFKNNTGVITYPAKPQENIPLGGSQTASSAPQATTPSQSPNDAMGELVEALEGMSGVDIEAAFSKATQYMADNSTPVKSPQPTAVEEPEWTPAELEFINKASRSNKQSSHGRASTPGG